MPYPPMVTWRLIVRRPRQQRCEQRAEHFLQCWLSQPRQPSEYIAGVLSAVISSLLRMCARSGQHSAHG
jgi:hypothetical protein